MEQLHDIYLEDARYEELMNGTVLPYLKSLETVHLLEREKGCPIYVEAYRLEHPRAMVILSHGFTENTIKYREIIYYFLKKGYQVVMSDHCNHGHSYRLVEDSSLVHVDEWERYQKDLLYVIHWAREEARDLPLYLYGHSMGGGIAASVLEKEPELFEKAILSSPMIRPLTGPLPWKRVEKLSEELKKHHKEKSYAFGFSPYSGIPPYEKNPSDSLARFTYYEELRSKDPLLQTCAPSFGWLYESFRLNKSLFENASSITTPFLLFQAQKDTLVSNQEQDSFVTQVNKSHPGTGYIVRFPDYKHEIYNTTCEKARTYWEFVFAYLEWQKK